MEERKELLKNIVYTFAKLSNVTDTLLCDDYVEKLFNLSVDDSIDTLLISLNSLVEKKVLTIDNIVSNISLLLALNPDKYHTQDDFIERLNWIKSMNLEYPKMPLTENHELVIETFDEFNKLIGTDFDCYYTGGLMGYFATNHPLERYHGDLDLFINEDQLFMLQELIDNTVDFQFISNMDHKEVNGHEYKIVYKNSPTSIGLFLFSRLPNKGILLKEYYYPNCDINQELCVDLHYLSPMYTLLSFSNQMREYDGNYYRMQSLESIYNSKKDSRPKDRYDASIIKNFIDESIDNQLDIEKYNNYDVISHVAKDSVVEQMENTLKNLKHK